MPQSSSLFGEYCKLLSEHRLGSPLEFIFGGGCIDRGIIRQCLEQNKIQLEHGSADAYASVLGPLGCLPLIVDPTGILPDARSSASRENCSFLLEILSADIANNIDLAPHITAKSVFVDEFPTGLFNACARPVDDGVIVLVDSGLIRVMFHVLTILFLAKTGRFSIIPATVGLSSIIRLYIKHPTEAYKPSTWAPFLEDAVGEMRRLLAWIDVETRTYALSPLAWYSLKFVICHEFAHIMLGHVRLDRTVVIQSPTGAIRLADRQRANHWKNELEADKTGMNLLLKSDDPVEPSIKMARVAAPMLVLLTLGMIEGIQRASGERHDVSGTQPPTEMRAQKFIESIGGLLSDDQAEKANRLANEFSIIGNLVIQRLSDEKHG